MRKLLGGAVTLAAVPVLLISLAAGPAPALPTSGNPPPPKGFEADSASFVTARAGFVLGARHCSEMPCQARLARTTDGGKTWAYLPAPPASLVPPVTTGQPTAVSTVRFVNGRDGWLFNPGLWATTDGGRHWRSESLPGMVVALAASGSGGASWHRTTFFDAGLGIRDLAYVSAGAGYLVHFSGGPVIAYGKGLMRTVNAGATWQNVRIP